MNRWSSCKAYVVRILLALAALLNAPYPVALRADENETRLEPPVVGAPVSFRTFGSAIGLGFMASMQAEPVELTLDSSLTLTIKITYMGQPGEKPQKPPKPAILGKLPDFESRFAIEKTVVRQETDTSWTFTYRLTPLTEDVKRIPSILFSYYSPLGFRTLEIVGVDIVVHPRTELQARDVENRRDSFPTSGPFAQFSTDKSVLTPRDRWSFPHPLILVVGLLLPPIICAGWYRLWQRLFPDEARRMQRRRSKAAGVAFRGLEASKNIDPVVRIRSVVDVMAGYFKERLGKEMAEPTPTEAALILRETDCTQEAIDQAGRFFDLCDVARFAPDPSDCPERVIPAAEELIRTLENET